MDNISVKLNIDVISVNIALIGNTASHAEAAIINNVYVKNLLTNPVLNAIELTNRHLWADGIHSMRR